MRFIEADVEGAVRLLDGLADRVDDRYLLTLGGDLLAAYEGEVFRTRGKGRWRRLSLQTKGNRRPLVATGLLLHNLSTPRISGDKVQVTAGPTRQHIARFHRQGARGMPKRDPAPKPPKRTREKWAHTMLDWITEEARS